ncbi:hypothetical protein [Pleomorphomonas sp. NRK KF1]|uniref:hypothetical protein n=1 Tax=Pleomorphomonas sp. NRK KF1 TaxID=2943000 RepID=UPI002042FE13|nr:hypothetical protein [Pleomorphomonas sp. NRK KF1]MCM5555231.1 hypothetical protein [Pleomorphomonas sp. NRK KF1]
MTDTPMPDDRKALLVAARVLEAIRPYCLLELTTRFTVSHDGHRLGAFTIDEALDLADAALAERKQP